MNIVGKNKKQLQAEIKSLKTRNKLLEKKLTEIKPYSAHNYSYKNIFDNSPISISIINKSGRTEFLNKIFVKTFGYTLKDIPDSEMWFKKAYPEKSYRTKVKSSWARAIKYNSSLIDENRSFRINCKNGKVKDIVFRLGELDSDRLILMLEDVSQRKEMENALIESEEKFRTIFEQSLLGIAIIQENKLLYFNSEFANCIGHPKEDLLALPKNKLYSLIHPQDRKFVKEQARKKLEGQRNAQIEYRIRYIAKDGTIKIVQNWSKSIRLNGKLAILATILDITEKVKAEQALIESEARIKSIFENTTIGIYRTSVSGEILIANPAIVKLLGYKDLKDFLDISVINSGYVNPADRIYFKKVMQKRGEIRGFECEWWKKDRSKVYVRESAVAVKNSSGKIQYYEGMVEDITDKKKAESDLRKNELKYQTLFNLTPSGIILTDDKGYILDANPAFCKSLGYSQKEIVNKYISIIAAPENLNEIENNLKVLNDGQILRHTIRNVSKYGEFRYMDLHETKIQLNETQSGILGVSNDITERKKFEEELIKSKEKAEKSDRLKTEFLAQISHEIRTPINSILSFTSYLHDELIGTKINEMNNIFDIIHKAGNRITRTIDMILNMSELQTGSYEPVLKDVDIYKKIVQPISNGFTRLAHSKNIKFTTECKTDISICRGDEYTLNQIFDNLINNAFKYTISGKVKIIVGRDKKNNLFAKVSDTGIGISEEFLSDIFEPFSQEEQGYTRKFEGNGLGLALVKKYCEINNASISVKSKKGVGTTFTITFN